jgi:hypothetical protein
LKKKQFEEISLIQKKTRNMDVSSVAHVGQFLKPLDKWLRAQPQHIVM